MIRIKDYIKNYDCNNTLDDFLRAHNECEITTEELRNVICTLFYHGAQSALENDYHIGVGHDGEPYYII